MITLCYLFIYMFEQFIAYMFFSKKFEYKNNLRTVILLYALSFLIQFGSNNINIPYINLATFFICNILVVTLGFKINFKQAIFNVLMLEGFMITTEIVVMYAISILLNIELTAYKNDAFIIFLETAATKMLYFSLAYIAAKLSVKPKLKYSVHDFSLSLFVLPLISIFIIISFVYLSIQFNVERNMYILFTVIVVLLLFSNILVFIVHEKIISVLTQNTEYQLEKQRTEINQEYYKELEQQYNLSNILIHDIKKHMQIIHQYSVNNENEKINQYIDSIYDSNEIQALRQFSNNKLVNVIVSRYAHLCINSGIELITDIRNIDFSFITESDLTSLLDNLLENAYESAKDADKKFIDISIDKSNEQYIVFRIKNTFKNAPSGKNGHFSTTKIDRKRHGFGLKSVIKITKKYNGQAAFDYNEDEKLFYINITIQIK